MTQDGQEWFITHLVPQNLRSGLVIYDVGGGKRPFLSASEKTKLDARVVGIDIDETELKRAPAGCYDEAITTDIASYQGNGDGDLIICQAVLEHVADVEGAFRSLSSILKPGGRALIFVPCRNALFARLNLLLPESVKRTILFSTDPRQKAAQGFPSFYRQCTPSGFTKLAEQNGLKVEAHREFWHSSYFYYFVPAYLLWRIWSISARILRRRNFCETFTMVLVKR